MNSTRPGKGSDVGGACGGIGAMGIGGHAISASLGGAYGTKRSAGGGGGGSGSGPLARTDDGDAAGAGASCARPELGRDGGSSCTSSTRPCHVYPWRASTARSASSSVASSTVPVPQLRLSAVRCTSARSTVPARRKRSLTSCQRTLYGRLRTCSCVRWSLAAAAAAV